MAWQQSETIDCTPDFVWAVMTDWSKSAYWLGVQGLRLEASKQPVGVGSRLSHANRSVSLSVIRQWAPERSLVLETTQLGLSATYAYTLEETQGKTLIRLSAEVTTTNGFWRLLLPVLRRMQERSDRRQLPALKRLTEAMVRDAERKADALQNAP